MNLRPGTELSLHYLNALNERARRGSTAVAGLGMTAQDSPGGMVFAQNPAPEFLADCQRMALVCGNIPPTIFPLGSLVHIVHGSVTIAGINYEMPGDPQQGICSLCDITGRIRLGVLAEGAKSATTYGGQPDCPMVQYQGIARVLWDWTSRPAWFGDADAAISAMNPVKHRLGARAGSPFAIWDDNGPLMMLDDAGPLTADDYAYIWNANVTRAMLVDSSGAPADDLHLAHVAIMSDRSADPMLCVIPGQGVPGYHIKAPYSCLEFGPDFTVTESGGDVFVTM